MKAIGNYLFICEARADNLGDKCRVHCAHLGHNPEGEFLVGFEGLESTLRIGLAVGHPWSQNH